MFRNNFAKICKEIKKEYKKKEFKEIPEEECLKKYVLAKNMIEKRVEEQPYSKRKLYLKGLKSEAQGADYLAIFTLIVAVVSLLVSIISCRMNIPLSSNRIVFETILECLLILICVLIIGLDYSLYKCLCIKEWRNYALTAIEEIEKEKRY